MTKYERAHVHTYIYVCIQFNTYIRMFPLDISVARKGRQRCHTWQVIGKRWQIISKCAIRVAVGVSLNERQPLWHAGRERKQLSVARPEVREQLESFAGRIRPCEYLFSLYVLLIKRNATHAPIVCRL